MNNEAKAYTGVKWHTLSIEEALNMLNTSVNGLSNVEATARLVKFGPNELAAARRVSPLKIF